MKKTKKVDVQQRNPHVFEGKYINISRRGDGSLYPALRRPCYNSLFTFNDFCHAAAEELMAVAGLVEKKQMAEK